jgi:hypothetical protein
MTPAECAREIDIKDFKECGCSTNGKDPINCEFPGCDEENCPRAMFVRGEITEEEFYKLWKEAQTLKV